LGDPRDLERFEEGGRMTGAIPKCISERVRERQRSKMGTLGSGNHCLDVQAVAEISTPAPPPLTALRE
jgi:tRNA-splicing ligase RtcB (3'-phosphate/5'-hydroxy nucleic acid ligase)